MTNTPQFDAALDAMFHAFVPHERTCRITGERFSVSADDIAMYRLLCVPPPTTSPWYRTLVRAAFFPYRLRSSFCAKTQQSFVGTYRSDSPFTVYRPEVWWSDAWDPKEYGRTAQPDAPFLPQWYALFRAVPRPGSSRDPESVNSEYTVGGMQFKDCYYVIGGIKAEDVAYTIAAEWSRSCLDGVWYEHAERCYDSVRLCDCYQTVGSINVTHGRDVAFCYDGSSIEHCFGGFNLRHRTHVFLDEQLDAATYTQRRAALRLGHRPTYERFQEWFREGYRDRAMHAMVRREKCERCVGSSIESCSDAYFAFCASECTNVRYVEGSSQVRDSAEISGSAAVERSYELAGAAHTNRAICVSVIRSGRDIEYCVDCHHCEHCFGCVGLRGAKFCILNQQYTEDEYWDTVDRLKTAMLARGEYGEFFPAAYAPVPFEDSRASYGYAFTRAERTHLQFWTVGDEAPSDGGPSIPPDDIRSASPEILAQSFRCTESGRSFRITPQELSFLQREDLPLPTRHPEVRMEQRYRLLPTTMRLYERACTQCGTKDLSDIPPDDPRKHVLCLTCYRKAIG